MNRQRFCWAAAAMAGAGGAPCAGQVKDFHQDFAVDFGVYAEWDEAGIPVQGPMFLSPVGKISEAWGQEQGEAFAEARAEGAGVLEQGPYETAWRLDVAFEVEARLGAPAPTAFSRAEAGIWIDWSLMSFEIEREYRLVITHEGGWRPFGVRDELLAPGLHELESMPSGTIMVVADPGEHLHDAANVSMLVRLIMTCRADLNGDGALDFFDFLEFQNLFAAGEPGADFNGDGALDFFDFLAFQSEFAAGCP